MNLNAEIEKSAGRDYDLLMEISVQSIGVVHSHEEGPREDGWGNIESEIRLDSSQFTEDALVGIMEFSHVEVIFQFHLIADQDAVHIRHPRGNVDWPKAGIFAQRGKDRPNHLGATICKVVGKEEFTLKVQGLDAYNGSPVLDIKPVMRAFLPEREQIKQPEWATELMKRYF